MKKVIMLSILLTINLFSKITPFEPNYEFMSISINAQNTHGSVSGFDIKNDTIYVSGSDNPLNILEHGGFYNFIKMSPDLGKTWNVLDSTFYTIDNLDYLDLYHRQFITNNKLFFFTDEDSLVKTTNFGLTWKKHGLHDEISDYMWTAGHLRRMNDVFIFSASDLIFKSFDDGFTWEKKVRVLPDSLNISYFAEDMQLLNDSTEYLVLTENTTNPFRKRFFITYDLKNNLPISIKPLKDNLYAELYIVSKDTIYMRETASYGNKMIPTLSRSTNKGDSWETLFVDTLANVGFIPKANSIIIKNGMLAFAIGSHLYVSLKQSDDFFRIFNPDSTVFGYVDIDSKGNIYAANFQLTSYYKFSNPFTSVQDNNPVGDQSTELMVYPNPATDEIEIPGIENAIMQEIEIFNILGEKVITTQLTASNKINVGHLPTGMYIIKIGDKITKFIKR
jgi:hypothetical protein